MINEVLPRPPFLTQHYFPSLRNFLSSLLGRTRIMLS